MQLGPVVNSSQLSTQRIRDGKRRRFWLASTLLSSLILLTIGLKDVNLRASPPIDFEQEADLGSRLASLALDRGFIVVAFLLLSFLLLLMIPLTLRKRGMPVLFFLSIFAFIFYLSSASPQRNLRESMRTPPALTEVASPAVQLTPAAAESPLAEFHPPQFSKLFLYLISLSVTLSLIFMVWMMYRWRRSRASRETTQSLEEIGEAARLALDDLAAGQDEKDAIINCYARMSVIVMHSRNIVREVSRTATEFAARLEAAGLPGDSVHRLTRLFEAVRYGARAPQQIEIEEAKDCLTDIARYCGEKA